jgi:hypothetical protein
MWKRAHRSRQGHPRLPVLEALEERRLLAGGLLGGSTRLLPAASPSLSPVAVVSPVPVAGLIVSVPASVQSAPAQAAVDLTQAPPAGTAAPETQANLQVGTQAAVDSPPNNTVGLSAGVTAVVSAETQANIQASAQVTADSPPPNTGGLLAGVTSVVDTVPTLTSTSTATVTSSTQETSPESLLGTVVSLLPDLSVTTTADTSSGGASSTGTSTSADGGLSLNVGGSTDGGTTGGVQLGVTAGTLLDTTAGVLLGGSSGSTGGDGGGGATGGSSGGTGTTGDTSSQTGTSTGGGLSLNAGGTTADATTGGLLGVVGAVLDTTVGILLGGGSTGGDGGSPGTTGATTEPGGGSSPTTGSLPGTGQVAVQVSLTAGSTAGAPGQATLPAPGNTDGTQTVRVESGAGAGQAEEPPSSPAAPQATNAGEAEAASTGEAVAGPAGDNSDPAPIPPAPPAPGPDNAAAAIQAAQAAQPNGVNVLDNVQDGNLLDNALPDGGGAVNPKPAAMHALTAALFGTGAASWWAENGGGAVLEEGASEVLGALLDVPFGSVETPPEGMVPLSQGADLVAGFLPFDAPTLAAGLQRFLEQFEVSGWRLADVPPSFWLLAAALAMAGEVLRRRQRRGQTALATAEEMRETLQWFPDLGRVEDDA